MKHILKPILAWFSPASAPEHKFINVLREYIGLYVIENDLKEETKAHYDVYFRNINLFLADTKRKNILMGEVSLKIMEDLRIWLRLNLKTCSITRASRHLELCKRVSRYALKQKYIGHDPLTEIEMQRSKAKNIIYLEPSEVKKFMVYKFANAYHQLTADLFVFQIGTGVSYKDIYDHEIVVRGDFHIIMGERKAERRYEARVFKEALDILNKYNNDLPRIPNQSYNKFLKEVAMLLGINKHLTTHVARKTHATILRQRGASKALISLQLGNTEKVLEQHYIGKSSAISENEFERLGIKDSLIFT